MIASAARRQPVTRGVVRARTGCCGGIRSTGAARSGGGRRVPGAPGDAVPGHHRAARPGLRRHGGPAQVRDPDGARRAARGRRAPGGTAAARPPPGDRSGLVPPVSHDRLCLLRRPVRRLAPGGPQSPGLPGRAGGHLPAPDAAAPAARGGERRRLRGGRLRPGEPARRHHGRPAGTGRRPARARHGAVRGPGAQPHRARARMGPQGAGRRARLPRDVPDLPGPHRTRRLRAHAARGVPRHRAGQLHPGKRPGLGVDELPRVPVGPELRQPGGVPGHAGHHARPGQPGHRRATARRGAVLVEADGHRLPEPARGSPAAAGVPGPDPAGGARPGAEGRGDRRPGDADALPRRP